MHGASVVLTRSQQARNVLIRLQPLMVLQPLSRPYLMLIMHHNPYPGLHLASFCAGTGAQRLAFHAKASQIHVTRSPLRRHEP